MDKEIIKDLIKNVGLEAFSWSYLKELIEDYDFLWNQDYFEKLSVRLAEKWYENEKLIDDELDDVSLDTYLDTTFEEIGNNYAYWYFCHGIRNPEYIPDFLELQNFTFDDNDIINDLDKFAEYVVKYCDEEDLDDPISEFKKEVKLKELKYTDKNTLVNSLYNLARKIFDTENIETNTNYIENETSEIREVVAKLNNGEISLFKYKEYPGILDGIFDCNIY